MEKDGPTFPGDPTFPRGRGSNCIFLYKPIEFVIFLGAGVRTPAPLLWIRAGHRLLGSSTHRLGHDIMVQYRYHSLTIWNVLGPNR